MGAFLWRPTVHLVALWLIYGLVRVRRLVRVKKRSRLSLEVAILVGVMGTIAQRAAVEWRYGVNLLQSNLASACHRPASSVPRRKTQP